ncbi:hypothetical protein LWI29_000387 [Acer saccharum]|uniref:Diacylglycerol O-acyltransferase n=1 Tax=Acer saccharum TaxID=4024 RepID=A0AA39RPF2_ACESA|nr:hypothetical protein LWI29_000387 [Acer saccharum]
MSTPMWDLHLLNLKTSNAETVAVLCVHHSLGDGTSLMSLFLASTHNQWCYLGLLGVTQAGLSRYLNRKKGESKIDHKGASENLRLSAGLQGGGTLGQLSMDRVQCNIILARPFPIRELGLGPSSKVEGSWFLKWRAKREAGFTEQRSPALGSGRITGQCLLGPIWSNGLP